MCLSSSTNKLTRTTKDIIVFKVFLNDTKAQEQAVDYDPNKVYSTYECFPYTIGELTKIKKRKIMSAMQDNKHGDFPYEFHVGLHAFTSLNEAIELAIEFHEYVYQCTIPKGSKVAYGDLDIVSNKLIVNKFLQSYQ